MTKVWNAGKIGYDQESLYFHEHDRKLIEEIRRKRAEEEASTNKKEGEEKLAKVIPFPTPQAKGQKKAA